MFTVDFYQTLLLAVATATLGGIALWTWQRAYWEYQLKRQRQDWMLRQCYARKDSQRQAMEELLVDMNRALEAFLTSAERLLSAIVRRGQHFQQRDSAADAEAWETRMNAWDQAVKESRQAFNRSELQWLADSRVLSGKLRLYFGKQSGAFEERWRGVIHQSEETCQGVNDRDINGVWRLVATVRAAKNDLLHDLAQELDDYVLQELVLPSQD